MNEIIEGLPGVLCLMDDVLVYGSDKHEHDTCLDAVLRKILNAGITLNKNKYEFAKTSITFLGHVINSERVSSDPKKTSAISDIKQFSFAYGFKHVTSSPYYPQGNGLAERMVKTVKNLPK